MDTILSLGLGKALGATLVALVAAFVGHCCRRPAVRHGLWLLVLLKLLAPPLVPLFLRPVVPTVTFAPPAVVSAPAAEPREGPPSDTAEADQSARTSTIEPEAARMPWATLGEAALGILWVGGALAWWTVAAVRLTCFHRLLGFAQPAPPTLQERAKHLAQRLGLRCCPGVWLVPAPVSPMLWALGRTPRLLLPAALWCHLDAEQQATLLTHELAHLRRRDHWVRRLELLVLGLYWWHPVVWWARHELRAAEEECCDAWVVWALPEAARAYATALLETVAFLSQARPALPAMASGAGHIQLLKRRLTMILRGKPSGRLSWSGLVFVLGLGAVLLPLWPTWAEPPQPSVEKKTEIRVISDGKVQALKEVPEPAEDRAKIEKKQLFVEFEAGDQKDKIQDEIELLQAQLEVKRAEMQAAKLKLAGAIDRMALIKKTYQQGATSEAQMLQAQGELTALEAQLEVKTAELKEPEVRLKQARRRLDHQLQLEFWGRKDAGEKEKQARRRLDHQLQQAQVERLTPHQDSSWATELFDQPFKNLGPLEKWRGATLEFRFHFKNTTSEKLHVSSVRVSNGMVTATIPKMELEPGEESAVQVRVDGNRLSGETMVRIYVGFDRPRVGEAVLYVFAGGPMQRGAAPPASDGRLRGPESETRKRLEDLDKKLDAILKEMDGLKRELRPQTK